ncbi:hypothetical protein OOT00_14670 [Desulfobotulus sp. H1]|uniref:Uncharacterized protein n=1 Tax=Desulfobotulus pelophilus TaxID=2823377 RepID=A0ABT3NCN9_9BACT|nr:hypothetical protein [Desulfobotulus pelophilus]MCW7755229.1 hypothetical protein [Desulfobotulus pelophilus]
MGLFAVRWPMAGCGSLRSRRLGYFFLVRTVARENVYGKKSGTRAKKLCFFCE